MTPFDYSALPRKRMATGALIRDEARRILVVRPTYREAWLVPGGVVEENESPRTACRREVHEETALDLRLGRLLCVEYRSSSPARTEAVHFIFEGGTLRREQIDAIRLPGSELAEYAFVPSSEATRRLTPGLARRVALALLALREGRTVYAEDGSE